MTQSPAQATDTRVLRAQVRFSNQPFVRPLLLSTGAIVEITQADAEVEVELGGVRSTGRGCIYLSDLWAWPDPAIDHPTRDSAMRRYAESLAENLPRLVGKPAHPLRLGLRLHEHVVEEVKTEAPWPPALARCVCASPFDAAIHDAVGRALGRSAFELYEHDEPVPEADDFFGGEGKTVRAIRALLQPQPRVQSPAWWVVGGADDLERDVAPVVREHGYFSFKLKIKGRDAEADARRTADVAAAARGWGLSNYRLSIDSNEANPDAASVGAYLDELERLDAEALERLSLIEQPTGRDIAAHPQDWRPVASRKPVLVDEGLLTLTSMVLARDQGWSGFALKSCKGHSFVLTAAAWADTQGMMLSLQDLTNPGLSAVHAALLSAWLPTINGVELNSPQFTPDANAGWRDALPGLFVPRDGLHDLPNARTPGLGSQLIDNPAVDARP